MAAVSPKKPPGPRRSSDEGGVVEVDMTRLSKGILQTFGVDLDHSQLKKLGYRAEKRHSNPNTYYRVPGVSGSIENCPKVVKHIKKVLLQGKQADMVMLLGKNAKPKLPPQPAKTQRSFAVTAAGEAANSKAEEPSEEEQESDAEMDNPSARNGDCLPAGWAKVEEMKAEKVMEGLAMYMQANTELKQITGSDLRAKGVMAIEESRPLGPGERMRHAHVWWPGKMDEPLRCAQYMFAAKSFIELPAVRQALGMGGLQAAKEAGALVGRKRPSSAADSAAAAVGPVAPSSAPPAVKRTRRSMSDAAVEGAAATGGKPAPAAAKTSPPAAAAAAGVGGGTGSVAERRRSQTRQQQAAAGVAVAPGGAAATAAGTGGGSARASHIPVSAADAPAADGKSAAAELSAPGKIRGASGRFAPKTGLVGAQIGSAGGSAPATGCAAAAAVKAAPAAVKHSQGNQQVLDNVDDAVQMLQEALTLGALLPPAVLNALPAVFTASLDGTLQDFLAKATTMREGLKADKELLLKMASDYAAEIASAAARSNSSGKKNTATTAESHYRRPYLAFRAALGVCAADAHAWLQDKKQRDMIARLEGLVQIKKQLEDKKSEEDRLRQEQEQMRLQQEKLQEELRAYKERIKRLEDEEAKRKAIAASGAADAKPAAVDQMV